jgi:hypothetical protein
MKEKNCNRCQQVKTIDQFYWKKTENRYSPYCRLCTNHEVLIRQQRQKLKAIEYKGGKCMNCGYDRCPAALDFHHRNPDEKLFGLSGSHLRKMDQRIIEELDKCDLLCANCHREKHWSETPSRDVNSWFVNGDMRNEHRERTQAQPTYTQCPTCNSKMMVTSQRCRICTNHSPKPHRRKIQLTAIELNALIKEHNGNLSAVGRALKVSDNAVRKFCIREGIDWKS